MKLIKIARSDALDRFSRSYPNIVKYWTDFGRDSLSIQLKNQSIVEYKISAILDAAKREALTRNIQIEYIA